MLQLVLGLFEALSHPFLLADAEVVSRLAAALLVLSREHGVSAELADGGRYPGIYLLAAHPDYGVRSLVRRHRRGGGWGGTSTGAGPTLTQARVPEEMNCHCWPPWMFGLISLLFG